MAVSQRVQILTDKSEELSVLAEFIKNPNLISQLSEEVKKLNSLTAEESAKVGQARKDLAEHESKMAILQESKDALTKAHSEHDEKVAADKAVNEAEQNRLKSLDAVLVSKAKAQADTDKRHEESRNKLAADCKALDSQYKAVEAGLAKREADVKSREDGVAAASYDLVIRKKKLDETAAKMKGLLAD